MTVIIVDRVNRNAIRYNYLVGSSVLIQDGLLAEIFAALAAFVGFLAGVDSNVLRK